MQPATSEEKEVAHLRRILLLLTTAIVVAVSWRLRLVRLLLANQSLAIALVKSAGKALPPKLFLPVATSSANSKEE